MKVSASKRKELIQAIASLICLVKMEKGCGRCDFFHGRKNKNIFCLLHEWDSMKDFEVYRESECHKVLQGAMHLLEEPYEMILYQRILPAEKIQRNFLVIQ